MLHLQVGSPGSLEKDMLPPFSEDIQKFLYIKIPTLKKTSVELVCQKSYDQTKNKK